MSSTKKLLIILLTLLNVRFGFSQDSGDHLKPVGGIYDMWDFQFEYYSKVRKILFEGLTESPEIRFQVMPSFTPENVLDIEYDRENDSYYLIYHICEKMIWYNDNWEEIKVDEYRTQIDKESVELTKKLFEIVIFQTRFSEDEIMGFDGTNYYFSIYKDGMKSGTIWTPFEGTKMNKLVDIGYGLIKLAQSEKEMVKFEGNFQNKIENLINELQ